MIIAIVPMKENNERLPNKNTLLLGDKPLCWYLLNSLNNSKVDKIIVDANGDSIVKAVQSLNLSKIEISVRPPEYCDPKLGGNELLKRFEMKPENTYLQCHVTSPFVGSGVINDGLEEMDESLFSVTKIHQRAWNLYREPLNHTINGPTQRTQDMEPIFVENGAFFMFTGKFFLENQKRNTEKSQRLVLSYPETIEIDYLEDLETAKAYIMYAEFMASKR